MKIKLIQWLLANQEALLKIVAVAKGWKKDGSYAEKWAVINAVAGLLIPLLEAASIAPKALAAEFALDADDEPLPRAMSSAEVQAQALSIDWQFLCEVVIPLVIKVLQLLQSQSA